MTVEVFICKTRLLLDSEDPQARPRWRVGAHTVLTAGAGADRGIWGRRDGAHTILGGYGVPRDTEQTGGADTRVPRIPAGFRV